MTAPALDPLGSRTGPQITEVRSGDRLIALIIPSGYREPGIHFFTPEAFSQQLAYIRHPAGKLIDSHVHNSVVREVHSTLEVLVIKSGRIRIDLYDDAHVYLESRMLIGGDVILLVSGGHGFEVIEEVEMIEVRQGPCVSDGADKTRFPPVPSDQLRVRS